ncbi:hypothetical protein RhiirA5_419201 [Rhizophagus irregularis]|uniref:MULE transposase domain-containing protein n=1 Tax=Rhizophagus irregularis TaxID=588596 RepID=A0A2N0PIN0_9GLOM|nr:hypothetical protein RhiirA5_419201 [Rhizophagus irregularis]
MSDSESISSDNSNDAIFSNDFIKSILDDSDSSENEDNYDMNVSPLMLEEGLKKYNLGKENRQLYVIVKKFIITNQINHQNQIEQIHFGHNLNITACHFETSKAFTKPMLKDIEWMYVSGHLKPLAIKCTMLKAKYNRKVYNQNFYKVIYKHQCKDDPRWIIYKDWDHKTNTLIKLFWMCLNQLKSWYKYSDIILNNNTSKTNCYKLSLSFFVAIDNNIKSRIITQALIDRETKDAYA